MLPRSLNRIAAKSSTTTSKQLSLSSLPARSPVATHLSRRTFVHPSRADRAAVVDLPTQPSPIPTPYILSFTPFYFPIFNPPFHHRSSLQTRPTTTPTTNLGSKPNLSRCSGPLFCPPTDVKFAHCRPHFGRQPPQWTPAYSTLSCPSPSICMAILTQEPMLTGGRPSMPSMTHDG
jgi:hypothetical protein